MTKANAAENQAATAARQVNGAINNTNSFIHQHKRESVDEMNGDWLIAEWGLLVLSLISAAQLS